ncbi:hypothetical protein SMACR_09601 [Sordaria macrospora]|uniref:WGS project CABT00000000 data, contig 2.107 n=2 Tax=Sordaria macrospora TaxID=5147 RepID=F7WCA4_SORMK|nr:uncharacterized protein SMAC_09601 [Sordaria macrospora k-hell]KAA8629389.1 hypothetical protein SMACR_09601 [Sordaria macrospora]WPJ62873.1 hypothetical protein SMAC4_09601 [Sordaria macrospora]CCC05574.1 unnamed protein product [Sordaria macrospora k-hell]
MPSHSTPAAVTIAIFISVIVLFFLNVVSASPLPISSRGTVDGMNMTANATTIIHTPQLSAAPVQGNGTAADAGGEHRHDPSGTVSTVLGVIALVALVLVWAAVAWGRKDRVRQHR